MGYETLITEERGKIAIVTLNRPEVINALSVQVDQELKDVFSTYAENKGIRAIILKGNGPGFCSGHDFREMREDISVLKFREIFGGINEIVEVIIGMDKPVIAAVHGVVAAGGCLLAAMCDMLVASKDSQFSTPGINAGLTCFSPMLAVCQYAHRKKALELALTGESISADEAYKIGLVNRVVPREKLNQVALQLAETIAEKSSVAVGLGKMFFYASAGMSFPNAMEYAREMLSINAMTKDFKEGLNAFFEKRKPNWTGE
jgi:enoyl-CoA hydratase/carnithine racemase